MFSFNARSGFLGKHSSMEIFKLKQVPYLCAVEKKQEEKKQNSYEI
jgi:hypothetical protein